MPRHACRFAVHAREVKSSQVQHDNYQIFTRCSGGR